jgi:hypothetical protein
VAIPARVRNTTAYPACRTRSPVVTLLSDAPIPVAVASVPWAKLNRPVPAVISATIMTTKTPKIPAPTSSSDCTARYYGLSLAVYSKPPIARTAIPIKKTGRRPQEFAWRPANMAIGIMTTWAMMMHAAM